MNDLNRSQLGILEDVNEAEALSDYKEPILVTCSACQEARLFNGMMIELESSYPAKLVTTLNGNKTLQSIYLCHDHYQQILKRSLNEKR